MQEIQKISPEGLDIALAYLENKSDVQLTAQALSLPVDEVMRHLDAREVKSYIDRMFNEVGFRNRDRMFGLMDEIISQKLEELDETGLGSNHDIIDILEKYHKMQMKAYEMEMKLQAAPSVQVNTQVNVSGGENYNKLLEKLVHAGK